MKLNKEEIKYIDDYLIKLKVKYIDVRLELIDHLATDFEENSDCVLLEGYLKTKTNFIIDFEKKRQKTIHWSYQKQLWKRLLMFFYKPKYLIFSLLLGLVLFFSIKFMVYFEASILLFLFTICFHISAYITHLKYRKILKKLQAAQPLYSIMSIPSLFLYPFKALQDYLYENLYLFFLYAFFGVLLSVAGYFEVYDNKSKIIERSKLILK